jgi:glycerate 2-kinase
VDSGSQLALTGCFERASRSGQRRPRAAALSVAAAGLRAAAPGDAVKSAVSWDGRTLVIDGVGIDMTPRGRVVVTGGGKASYEITAALERALGDRIDGGIVVVPHDERRRLSRVEVLVGDHPLPANNSAHAGRRLLELAGTLGPDDLVLGCFTGGCSAMVAQPPDGVTIADKRELTRVLLQSGLPILEINSVRKHVSEVKGGRLARAIAPARIVNLTVSDVAGDSLDLITDPTVRDSSTPADAVAVIERAGLRNRVPGAIATHLLSDGADSPELDGEISTKLLVTGTSVSDAMAAEATRLGWDSIVVSTALEGEARTVGGLLADLAITKQAHGQAFTPPCILIGCGGESTVTLDSDAHYGKGGPNQEAALALALALTPEHEIAAVFIDTDGHDGGTPNAGAVVDGLTTSRADSAGIDLKAALAAHGSGAVLGALGDALVTGQTGTNVNDLFAVAVC